SDLTAGAVTLSSATDLALAHNVGAGTLSLQAGGAISQSGGVLSTGTLTGSSTGDTTLNGANLIGTLSNFSAANFSLSNAQALAVSGPLTVPGSLSLSTTTGALDMQGNVSAQAVALNSATDLALANNITGASVSLASGGNISQSAGVLAAGTLSGHATGSVVLTQANKIDNLGAFSAANGFDLANAQALSVTGAVSGGSNTRISTGAGVLTVAAPISGNTIALAGQAGLAVNAAVNAGAGDITLGSAAGAISEGAAGGLTAGSLSGNSAGATALNGANQVATLGNFSTGGNFSFTDMRTLTVNSPLSVNGGNGDLSLTTTGTSSDLILADDLQGGVVTLVAGRDIKQAGSTIQAATLNGSAGGNALLTAANRIGTLGNFTAASLTLNNAQSLAVGGSVNTGSGALALTTSTGQLALTGALSGGAVALTSAGNLALNGQLAANTLALQSGGAITEAGAGAITANSLTGSSSGSTTLNLANHVATLGTFGANGFQFTNAGSLAVSGPIDGGSNTSLTTTAGDLSINGRVSGTTTTLASAGAITEGSSGTIVASNLTGHSGGATTLSGANSVDTLGAFNAAGFSLTNAKALTISGPVAGGTTTTLITTAGDLHIDGALSGTSTSLQSAGAIAEGSAGKITAATLSGRAVGGTTLGTAALMIANQISTLGNFSSTGGFSLTNGKTLTLASVNGSAFTVDAGHSDFYLTITQGDLLQQGKTPLYDGAGTFYSTGKMGTGAAPLYVIGDSAQLVAKVGAPPAYFYAVDRQGNILPLTGELSFNVPTSAFFSKAQNGNGRGDAYIDPSVISANYRSFGIVPSGILLPADQQQCQPELEDCPLE
ncbi:MAG: hypothetical protein WC617_20135, partial [Rhodanobacter sp.]